MPTLVISSRLTRLDGSVRAKAYTFFAKLQDNDTTPGLHIEPITGSADPRVRTGRVDVSLRAVMFKLVGTAPGAEPHYVMHGIWPHDEAIAIAKRVVLSQNPVNGMPVIDEVPVDDGPVCTTSADVPTGPDGPVRDLTGVEGQAVPSTSSAPLLVQHGYSRHDLIDVLGVPPDIADAALAVSDEDSALSLAAAHEGWLGLVLLSLATGDPVDSIMETLALGAQESSGDEDDDLVAAVTSPAARTDFAVVDGQDELRAVIESDDFAAWRVFLHPEQRRYVDQATNGPFRLSGGAGTGKTVVLVHRARALARRAPSARIVLTTFTVNLADALRDQVQQLDPRLGRAPLGGAGVHVTGIDALAQEVIRRATAPELDAACTAVVGEPRHHPLRRTPQERWQSVVLSSTVDLPVEIAHPDFLAEEYSLVVLPHRILTEADYVKVRRPGRGVSLDRAKRRLVWKLIDTYRSQARVEGTLDHREALAVAAELLTSSPAIRRTSWADHVLVDEGQDLSPTHWQLLRALVEPGPDDLFIAEDSHQRIYGPRTVLSRYGIAVRGRSRRLTLNYRTTAQNLRWALDVLAGADWHDLEGEPEATGYRSARTGPPPQVEGGLSLDAELRAVTTRVTQWRDAGVDLGTVAVLVPNVQQAERVVQVLTAEGLPAKAAGAGRPAPSSVAVMTQYRSKGTEFSRVVITDAGWLSPPQKQRLASMDPAERDDYLLKQRSLLYVAGTRARDELVVLGRH